MADVSNPLAIRKVNEQVRPLCEELRGLKARILALQTDWFGGLNTAIGTGSGAILDGRDAEGVSRLTQDEVTNAVANLIAVAAAANDEIVAKPCVRPL